MQLYTAYGFSVPGTTTTAPIYNGNGNIGGRTLPTRASGGPVTANRPYVVGEAGPEVIVPRSSGYVIPNGAAMNININVAGATMDTIRATSRQQALNAFSRILDQLGAA